MDTKFNLALKVLAVLGPALATGAGSWYTARSDAEKSYAALSDAVQDLQASIKTLESNQDRLWQVALVRPTAAAPAPSPTPSRPSAAAPTLLPPSELFGRMGAARPAPPAPAEPVQEALPELKPLPKNLSAL